MGHNIQSSMEAIRPHLGICPQYNVLFDRCVPWVWGGPCRRNGGTLLPSPHPSSFPFLGCRLTVAEHIWFYGRMKGLSASAVSLEQSRLIHDVGLVPKWGAETRHLSGKGTESRLGEEKEQKP